MSKIHFGPFRVEINFSLQLFNEIFIKRERGVARMLMESYNVSVSLVDDAMDLDSEITG